MTTVLMLAGAYGDPNLMPQMLGGTITAGNTLVPVHYPNSISLWPTLDKQNDKVSWTSVMTDYFIDNVNTGATDLDDAINAVPAGEPIVVLAHSMGGQVAQAWLKTYGPSSTRDPSKLRFVLLGNSSRKYGGLFRNALPQIPAGNRFPVQDLARQYDGWADWGGDPDQITNWDMAFNAWAGMSNVHLFYQSQRLDDPTNVWFGPENNVRYGWSPTYPVPTLGTTTWLPNVDATLRPKIEAGYNRPVDIPTPAYSGMPGWWGGTPPVSVPKPPVTGWWAEALVNAAPNPAALRIIGSAPDVRVSKLLRPVAAALTITGSAPAVVISQHRKVTPAPTVLTVIGSHPALGNTVRPPAAALAIDGGTPAVKLSDNKRISPAPAELELTGAAPQVLLSDNTIIRPAAAELSVSGAAPAVITPRTVTPAPAELAVTGSAPDITVTVKITPDPAVLVLDGGQPTVSTPVLVRPAPALLEIIGSHPALTVTVRPPAADLTVVGGTPAVLVSDNQRLTPAASPLTVTGGTPSVRVSDHQVVRPAPANLAVTGRTPIVSTPRLVTPGAAAMWVTGATPDIVIFNPFTPYNDIDVNLTDKAVPQGCSGVWVRLCGRGGDGGDGEGHAGSTCGGGGGGGSAAIVARIFIPAAYLPASTYSLKIGTSASHDTVFTCGSLRITAGGGHNGENGSAYGSSSYGDGGSGGTVSWSGSLPAGYTGYGLNGKTGAKGGYSGSGAGRDGTDATTVQTSYGPGPGGGGGVRGAFNDTYPGGDGGRGYAVHGSGAPLAGGAGGPGGDGTSAVGSGQILGGGGGGGGAGGAGYGGAGGRGGDWGGGGGGGAGGQYSGAGGTGGAAHAILEWV